MSQDAVILLIASVGGALIIRFGVVAVWGSGYEAYDASPVRALSMSGIRIGVYQLAHRVWSGSAALAGGSPNSAR